MSDFDDFQDYQDLSWQLQDASMDMNNAYIDFSNMADQAWINGEYDTYHQLYMMSENFQDYSNDLYQASWDAWYGPVNAEGYTAYDASMGYSAYDTSFIEPASSAGSMSMISDYNTSSTL
ncbi:MAG: hypothetical protein AB7L17_14175 [Ilumatobacteraceae bacterium]|jgi:hypothetical protein